MGKSPRQEGVTKEELDGLEERVRLLGRIIRDPETNPLKVVPDYLVRGARAERAQRARRALQQKYLQQLKQIEEITETSKLFAFASQYFYNDEGIDEREIPYREAIMRSIVKARKNDDAEHIRLLLYATMIQNL